MPREKSEKIEKPELSAEDKELELMAREEDLEEKEKELSAREAKLNREQPQAFQKSTSLQTSEIEDLHAEKALQMKENLNKQQKVRMFLPLEGTEKPGAFVPVTLNGYRLNVPKGVYVDVPEQVADVLRESFDQTEAALRQNRIDLDSSKTTALS